VEMHVKSETNTLWFEPAIRNISDRTGLAIHWGLSYWEHCTCSNSLGVYSNSAGKVYRGVILKGKGRGEEFCVALHRIA